MATATGGFITGVLATLAAVLVVPKLLKSGAPTAGTKPLPPAHDSGPGYYVLQWFGPARGKPDVIGGPWDRKSGADKAAAKYKAASKRIREPLATRVRYFETSADAHNASP